MNPIVTSNCSPVVHHGLFYDTANEMADAVLPYIRAGLADENHLIYLQIDPQQSDRIRALLGEVAERLVFEPPEIAMLQPVRKLAGERSARRLTVVRQYPAAAAAARTCILAENEVNGLSVGRGVTVVCVCRRTAPGVLAEIAARSHRTLLGSTGVPNPNDRFRPDRVREDAYGYFWGEPTARCLFQTTAQLAALRGRVADIARSVGLSGDALSAAVLSVHEAAAALCRSPSARELEVEDRIVDVYATQAGVFLEIRALLTIAGVSGPVSLDRLGSSLRIADFCRYVSAFDRDGVRTVRLLVGADE